MPVSNDEFALSSQAASGDRRAFAILVRRHEARVRSFLTRLAGVHVADDLAQETFLRAWRNAGRFRGCGSYIGWLLSIAWRVFLDAHRRHRTEQGRLAAAGPPDQIGTDPSVKVDVETLFAALDPDERAPLALCLGQGWSHAEAAEILAVPLGTLKSRLARATAKCRRILEAD
jgi:RNA polymerase sigma-70 factor (ECF subfamily)